MPCTNTAEGANLFPHAVRAYRHVFCLRDVSHIVFLALAAGCRNLEQVPCPNARRPTLDCTRRATAALGVPRVARVLRGEVSCRSLRSFSDSFSSRLVSWRSSGAGQEALWSSRT